MAERIIGRTMLLQDITPDDSVRDVQKEIRRTTLQYFDFYNRSTVSGFLLRGELHADLDSFSENLVLTLRASMLGRECWTEETTEKDKEYVRTEYETFKFPSTWWDFFKRTVVPESWWERLSEIRPLRWMAPRFTEINQVMNHRYETITHVHKHFKLCPYLAERTPRDPMRNREQVYIQWLGQDGPVKPDPKAQAWRDLRDDRQEELEYLRSLVRHNNLYNPFEPREGE